MAVHSQDKALLCRVFPSSLRPMPMRWFDVLRTNSISSFKKFTQSFCSRFITCSRVLQPLNSLLSMTMREWESVKAYVKRYWEMFNEIDGDFDEVAIRTFKVGLPSEHGLRKSLTGKPVTSLRQLVCVCLDFLKPKTRINEKVGNKMCLAQPKTQLFKKSCVFGSGKIHVQNALHLWTSEVHK